MVETLISAKAIQIIKENQAKVEITRFVHITNFELTAAILSKINHAGRMRWNIENEGFNEQKNTKYNLQHKYSRTSFIATQNYYQCLQIAHIINQLVQKSTQIKALVTQNDSFKSFEELATALLFTKDFALEPNLNDKLCKKVQFRY